MQSRALKDITIIVLHCSDSDYQQHDNIETIRDWHRAQGFDDVGYHYVVTKSGRVEIGRPLTTVGAHVKGHNFESVGICLTGAHQFSDAQFASAARLIDHLVDVLPSLKTQYGIVAHRIFNKNKTCPNYEIKKVLDLTTKRILGIDIGKNGKLVVS